MRLTADDGYQAQRSYSIASAPERRGVELTVERLENGEVSAYIVGELRVGDALELRGPIGGYFVWSKCAADRCSCLPADPESFRCAASSASTQPY